MTPSESALLGDGGYAPISAGSYAPLKGPAAVRAVVAALQQRAVLALGRFAAACPGEDTEATRTRGVRLLMQLLFALYSEAHGLLPVHLPAYVQAVGLTGHATSSDLRARLVRLFEALEEGDAELGVAAAGGGLFEFASDTALVDEGALADILLLLTRLPVAVGPDQPVPWGALAPEQLGHIYEALLAVDVAAAEGGVGRGTKRRAAGAHYTPRELTEPVVRAALAPLFDELAGLPPEARAARLLEFTVCDMSMGAGAFLIEAARALSTQLVACWQAGGAPPDAPHALRLRARRFVVEHCLYGVDRDPLAVEMARLTLWAFTEARGLPLSTFDHRLRCGDALLGLDAVQLRTLSLDRRSPEQGFLFQPPVEGLVERALSRRAEIAALPKGEASVAAERSRLQAAASDAMTLLALTADTLVAAHLGANTDATKRAGVAGARAEVGAMLKEWRALGGPGPRARALRSRAEAALEGRNPLHWAVAFPEVFLNGARAPGFDAIIGNPPFANAIRKTTGRDQDLKAFFQAAFAEVAQGAYDVAALFMVAAVHHLRPGGRYALIQPRSNLSQRSALPVQRWLAEHAPLDVLLAPKRADLFPGASVYVAVVMGHRAADSDEAHPPGVGSGLRQAAQAHPPAVRVAVGLEPGEGSWVTATPGEPWWALVTALDRPSVGASGGGHRLGDFVTARAGCTTSTAYLLREHVVDDAAGTGPRLITTGLIDRHCCLWGDDDCRFLKGRFANPRWPAPGSDVPGPLVKAVLDQRGPKVLVAGLSRRVEAFADVDGVCAGVVSTHVLRPSVPGLDVRIIAAVVSSWIFSYEYMRLFGAKRMGDGNWTIGKRELLHTPAPAALADAGFQRQVLALLDRLGAPDEADELPLQALIAGAYGVHGEGLEQLRGWYFAR